MLRESVNVNLRRQTDLKCAIYIYRYTYIQTDRDRQTDRQTDRHTYTNTHTTDRYVE